MKAKSAEVISVGQLSSHQKLQVGEIYDAWVSSNLADGGIGHLVVSCKFGNQIFLVDFLVDVYCLGVNDVLIRQETQSTYQNLINMISISSPLVAVAPSYAKKLVLDAVSYAASVGIDPHDDYYKYKAIFNDVDAGECLTEFKFGKDGKPFLITHPENTEQRIKKWLRNLNNTCGTDGFDHLIDVKDD